METRKIDASRGFTLVEILLALAIMGVIAVFAISLSGSVRNAAKVKDTQQRMEEVVVKLRAFYRNTETLPAAGGAGTDVPVGAGALNMEQKYRYDGWGQTVRYYFHNFSVPVVRQPLGPGTTTVIVLPEVQSFIVDGKAAAGVLVSNGPDQTPNSTPSPNPATGSPPYTINTTGDDIVIPLDLSQEAVELALDELRILQAKVKAFDALYEGINNGGATTNPDEDGCVAAEPKTTAAGCPPTNLTNDPNCGVATLDEIADDVGGQNYACAQYSVQAVRVDAVGTILDVYSLAVKFAVDPWGNGYVWGRNNATTVGGKDITGTGTGSSYYHKFYSLGPDVTVDDDDIIP